MIVYNLRCSQDHLFEEWFSSGADYQAKAEARKIPCPECGDTRVTKAIMAPNVNSGTAAPRPACGATGCAETSCPMMAGRN